MPLDKQYKILDEEIPFIIPGFESSCPPGAMTLAPEAIDCRDWYHSFAMRVAEAHGKKFLPVCRMSDGEFHFLLGPQPANPGSGILPRIAAWLEILKDYIGLADFTAGAGGHYNSGKYSAQEWKNTRTRFETGVEFLSRTGTLAIHLSYGNTPFQERYFPAFGDWLASKHIQLNLSNYVPFYYVYALLTGPDRKKVLRGRILVINGAVGRKKDRIIASLIEEGASEVIWHPISESRSMFDTISSKEYAGKVDIAIIGAGIGKLNIFPQLQELKVPCIDAGYVFEVWDNRLNSKSRSFCEPEHS